MMMRKQSCEGCVTERKRTSSILSSMMLCKATNVFDTSTIGRRTRGALRERPGLDSCIVASEVEFGRIISVNSVAGHAS